MLTLSWRSVASSSALAMALIVGLPALAEAQLFPNLWIQRQRTECANEPPFYSHVRRDYYGYYPTCWRTFPEGWACPCPNPERPDREKSFRDLPRDDKKDLPSLKDVDDDLNRGGPGIDPGVGPGAGPRPNDPNLPGAAGSTRSPFEIDNKRPAVPNDVNDPFLAPSGPAATPGAGAAPGARGVPPASGSPFDSVLPRSSANGVNPPHTPALDGPSVARPRRSPARPYSSVASAAEPRESGAPVLALPEIGAPAASLPEVPPQVTALPSSLPTNGAFIEIPASAVASNSNVTTVAAEPIQAPSTAPVQAPTRRTSIIGSLFGMGSRTQR